MEAARQRLEEYQRALQTRASVAAQAPPPRRPPLLSAWSSQLAAGLSHFPNSAMQTSSRETPTRENAPAPRPPDFRCAADVASFRRLARSHPADAPPSLTEVLLERITRRLQGGAGPGHSGALPPDPVHPLSLGPPPDRRERQQGQTRAREVERTGQLRQQLPDRVCSDGQVGGRVAQLPPETGHVGGWSLCAAPQAEPVAAAPPERRLSGSIGQTRRRLLQSLLRAIEQRNGGTLSHLEDGGWRRKPTCCPLSLVSSVDVWLQDRPPSSLEGRRIAPR